jgi:hypothetical protein
MGNVQARIDYIFYVACVAAPLSVIGSLLTLLTIYRSKQHSSTYHRLVTGIATYDIMLSSSLSFGPFLLPAETGLPGAKGTTATCAAQGFFTYLGTLSFAYSAMLMWYYVAVIRYSVTEAFLAKWIEPWMHIFPATYYLVTAFLGLRWKVLGPATPMCLVGGRADWLCGRRRRNRLRPRWREGSLVWPLAFDSTLHGLELFNRVGPFDCGGDCPPTILPESTI